MHVHRQTKKHMHTYGHKDETEMHSHMQYRWILQYHGQNPNDDWQTLLVFAQASSIHHGKGWSHFSNTNNLCFLYSTWIIRPYLCKDGNTSLGDCVPLALLSGQRRPWRWGWPPATRWRSGDCTLSTSQTHSRWQTLCHWWWWRSQRCWWQPPPEDMET